MNKRLLGLAVAGSMVLGLGTAQAGVPNGGTSEASAAGTGTILIVPDASGDNLGARGLTITVTVRDVSNNVIAGFPFQDVTLSSAIAGELAICQGGASADANTDVNGQTTFSGNIAGGGSTEGGLQVFLNEVPVTGNGGSVLAINANSPDINGDLTVDVVDVGFFAQGFGGDPALAFAVDLISDGNINIADVGQFAVGLGTVCP
jgi:hypothetical protein